MDKKYSRKFWLAVGASALVVAILLLVFLTGCSPRATNEVETYSLDGVYLPLQEEGKVVIVLDWHTPVFDPETNRVYHSIEYGSMEGAVLADPNGLLSQFRPESWVKVRFEYIEGYPTITYVALLGQ